MTCEGYSCGSLMGNWFEERQALQQESRKKPDLRIKREGEDILYETYDGLKKLAKIKRRPKWNTKPVIADHGYRNYTTLTKDSFRKNLLDNYYKNKDLRPLKKSSSLMPKAEKKNENMQTQGSENFKMLTEGNAHQRFVKRGYNMNTSDFRSTLRRHEDTHDKFFSMTNYRESYTNGDLDSKTSNKSLRKSMMRQAGVETDPKKMKGKRMTTFLVGESYRDFEDPQQNIHCQRSWVYGGDKTLDVVEDNLNQTLKGLGGKAKKRTAMNVLLRTMFRKGRKGDNPTSLPLEDGEREFFPKLKHVGAHRRIQSDITRVMNKSLTYK